MNIFKGICVLLFALTMWPVLLIGFLGGMLWWSILAGFRRSQNFQDWILDTSDIETWRTEFHSGKPTDGTK